MKLVKGQRALFYQNEVSSGYYVAFESMYKQNGIDLYKTKVGLFKNVKLCSAAEYIVLTKRNPTTSMSIKGK